MAMPTEEYQFFWSHVVWALEVLIVFIIQIRKSVHSIIYCIEVLLLGATTTYLIFIVLNAFYFFWFVVYLIVLNMQKGREWYAVVKFLVLHRLKIHFKSLEMN